MPYTTVPVVSDNQILSASYLNLLASNQSFLYGVGNQANAPFNSFRAVKNLLDEDVMLWYIRHRVNWLHWKFSAGADWTSAHIFYNGVKVGAQQAAGRSWTGTCDLSTWATLPNLLGAWASGVAYDDDFNGDGQVVTQSGAYYRCKVAHTSAAGNQPGIGASWNAFWDLLTLPSVGTMCVTWAHISFASAQEVTVEYIVETDSSSF